MDEYENCGPDLKGAHFKRGVTDNTPVTQEYEKKQNAAIEARCGKPTAELPTVGKTGRNPWDR